MSTLTRLGNRLLSRRTRLQLARDARPAAVTAALAAAGMVAAIVLFTALQVRLPWEDRYVTKVAVRNAAGVVPQSADVRISGVPVGKVTRVEIEGRRPVLTVELEGGRGPLYRDAQVQMRPGTPLNDMYLDVTDRGSPRAGALGRDDVLLPSRTSQPVDISRVLDVFDAGVRPRVRTLIVELGEALDEDGDGFKRTLVELAPFLRAARRMSEGVAERSTQMKRLVHNFDAMTGELGRREGQLASLVGSAGQTFDELGNRSSELSQLLVELPALLQEVPPAFADLHEAADHLDPALTALRPAARALPQGLTSLARLAPDLRAGTGELNRAVAPVEKLLRSSMPLARDLTSAFHELTPQLKRVDRMNQRAHPCHKALASYLQYWLSVYKLHDDFTVLTHGQSNYGASSAAGTSDPALTAAGSCTGTRPKK